MPQTEDEEKLSEAAGKGLPPHVEPSTTTHAMGTSFFTCGEEGVMSGNEWCDQAMGTYSFSTKAGR